jgi:hypothetical protein
MRIGIRVQLAVLVLLASLIGLAVLTLATWVNISPHTVIGTSLTARFSIPTTTLSLR